MNREQRRKLKRNMQYIRKHLDLPTNKEMENYINNKKNQIKDN